MYISCKRDVLKVIYLKLIYLIRTKKNPDMWSQVIIALSNLSNYYMVAIYLRGMLLYKKVNTKRVKLITSDELDFEL